MERKHGIDNASLSALVFPKRRPMLDRGYNDIDQRPMIGGGYGDIDQRPMIGGGYGDIEDNDEKDESARGRGQK